MNAGIDYGRITATNRNVETGIHYGCISPHSLGAAWNESSQPYYGDPDEAKCPECGKMHVAKDWGETIACECGESFEVEVGDFAEPLSWYVDDAEIFAEQRDRGVMVTRSLYYTHAAFCSPCVPGAGDLDSPCADGPRTYCFGPDWFEGGVAPYPVFRVATGEQVNAAEETEEA